MFVCNKKSCSWRLPIIACEVARRNEKTKEELAVALDDASSSNPSEYSNLSAPVLRNYRSHRYLCLADLEKPKNKLR